jgi:hypothetical protein
MRQARDFKTIKAANLKQEKKDKETKKVEDKAKRVEKKAK